MLRPRRLQDWVKQEESIGQDKGRKAQSRKDWLGRTEMSPVGQQQDSYLFA